VKKDDRNNPHMGGADNNTAGEKGPANDHNVGSFIPSKGGVSGGPVDDITIEDLDNDDLLDDEWMEDGATERGHISDKNGPVQETHDALQRAIGGSVMPSGSAMTTTALLPVTGGPMDQPLSKSIASGCSKKAELQFSAEGEKATPKSK
jgi:hypothetical protein